MTPDYQARAQQYGFASPQEVKEALSQEDTYVLDTRTEQEIAQTGKLQHAHWVQTECTATACPELSLHPQELLPDKMAKIVLYCRSGRRANKAKEILMEQGYQGKIMNAGGFDDLKSILRDS